LFENRLIFWSASCAVHCSQEKYLFVNQSSELDGFRFIIDTLKL